MKSFICAQSMEPQQYDKGSKELFTQYIYITNLSNTKPLFLISAFFLMCSIK